MFAELTELLSSFQIPAEWIGLRVVKESSQVHQTRDAIPQGNGRTLSQGVMVEVLVNGHIGYGATNSLTPPAIRIAAWNAYKQALAASKWALNSLSSHVRPQVKGTYLSPILQPFGGLSSSEIQDVLHQLSGLLKVSSQIVQTNASVITNQTESWLVSSNGSEVYQNISSIQTHLGATAQDGGFTQTRTDNGYQARCYQGGWEFFVNDDLWVRAERVGVQAVELLTVEDCPTTTTTLVLAPDQMMLQIHESVGHPLELDRILGDERNYAGGSFVKPDDFGQLSYGSTAMTISFNPTVPEEFASYGFDDTGAPAGKDYLIRNGQLLKGLGGLESQHRSGIEGVSCARACSWNRPAIDRMANLNLEPGTDTFDEIIGGIELGIYMETNRSWSIDDQRHKFQFGCEYARLIENGQLTETLRNPNYRGTTLDFWHNLVRVGDANTWQIYGTPFCGKGEPNQSIRVGHGSPVCAFKNIELFGGD